MIIFLQIKSHQACIYRRVESSSVLRRGLDWDRRHHTHNRLSALPAGRSIRNQNIVNFRKRREDLGVTLAGFAIMPKRSFDICLVIFFLGDPVDGVFDSIEVLRVLVSEPIVLNSQHTTANEIND